MPKRALVVGLGLIGGSIAKCIQKAHPETIVEGYDQNDETSKLAKILRVIDEENQNVLEAASRADFIVLATPVEQTVSLLGELARVPLRQDCLVIDVGSTKRQVMEAAKPLQNNGVTFIGGHPMAGSHKSGIQAARDHLFENAIFVLTPSSSGEKAINQAKEWLQGTKASFVVMPADEHDEITGVVSHFPHLVAASLVRHAFRSYEDEEALRRFAAGGFRDITRIASSNPTMWRDITLQNRDTLLRLLYSWKDEMDELTQVVELGDGTSILHFFQRAKSFRDELPQKKTGLLPSFFDLYVDVPDVPGVLSEITGHLAEESISVVNIRIVEARDEEVIGVLVLSFSTEDTRSYAAHCLRQRTTYEVTEAT
ncbi:prephenate dehydrogenase [Bacillus fonticola]|uniref:prephenate dehydrogenase n=1 Tax=Bacillus fonticola TaxID=2728853 RepID=UPI0014765805|nr:prephenate dehydrogenase [Bacillus fonticola]